ncbi:putative zinc-binding peptidase [Algoriphagus lutimaris]|uniref:zinc-binding metallopeptidase family protein n=1 Tax=Algoriphagus lutimaris TaxID=613197 RepID=UPI00196A7482|nr:putative zinc-binding peptidase [Algoriphagus lutimaris]MBN3521300.1 putative zinc-binding peptidase [Algoriphagus lutimaris]
MKIFECGKCFQPLYFENQSCEKCGHLVGFSNAELDLKTFENGLGSWKSDGDNFEFKFCKNKEFGVCNWLIPASDQDDFCVACKLNRTIPDLSDAENFKRWQKLEIAKHRLIYQLVRLGLNPQSIMEDPNGLTFDFINNQYGIGEKAMTGHDNGVITILLSEADAVHREQMKKEFAEPYRTLIGHFRHEVGHYFWDRLVFNDPSILQEFRNVFGDERANYGNSLNSYYSDGPQSNWQQNYISQYATSHPWEDWAETWAHYLHIMDMAETAYYFGMRVEPKLYENTLDGAIGFDPYDCTDFEKILKDWGPISFAINSLNRSMGMPDMYPFVISPIVKAKMEFIHRLVYRS